MSALVLFPEGTVPKTVGQLGDLLSVGMLALPSRKFPTSSLDGRPYYDFDGLFRSLELSVERLRSKLGSSKSEQLRDMLMQARAHHLTGWKLNGEKYDPKGTGWREVCLGNYLLQDAHMVLKDRQPWAYPKEIYRWSVNPWHSELSEADLKNKGDE